MMNNKGIFMWYQRCRANKTSGQIVVMLTLVIAMLFLLIVVLINIGQIAQTKALMQVAADGAALSAASTLVSYAHFLSITYLKGRTEHCERDWERIFAYLFIVFLVIVSFGTAAPAAAAWTTAAVTTAEGIGIALNIAALIIKVAVIDPDIIKSLNETFAKMPGNMKIEEYAIQYALTNSVSDTEQVLDVEDMDQDGRIDDKVGRFAVWYANRVIARVGNEIDTLISAIKTFINTDYRNSGLCLFAQGYAPPIDITQYPYPQYPEPPLQVEHVDAGDFLAYLGDDTGQKLTSTGKMYPLFYEISESEQDPQIGLQTNLMSFWIPGFPWAVVPQPCGGKGQPPCGTPPPPPDSIDGLYLDIFEFHLWANGGIDIYDVDQDGDRTEVLPGILSYTINNLISTFDIWFSQLYGSYIVNSDDSITITPSQDSFFSTIQYGGYGQDGWDVLLDTLQENLSGLKEDIMDCVDAHLSEISRLEDPDAQRQHQDIVNRLYNYVRRVNDVVYVSEAFERVIPDFLTDILAFRNVIETVFQRSSREATYSWQDGRGLWHHVRVRVDPANLPRIEAGRDFPNVCNRLVNGGGIAQVQIKRYDEDKDILRFASGIPLWKFRFRNPFTSGNETDTTFDPSDPNAALTRGMWSRSRVLWGIGSNGNPLIKLYKQRQSL